MFSDSTPPRCRFLKRYTPKTVIETPSWGGLLTLKVRRMSPFCRSLDKHKNGPPQSAATQRFQSRDKGILKLSLRSPDSLFYSFKRRQNPRCHAEPGPSCVFVPAGVKCSRGPELASSHFVAQSSHISPLTPGLSLGTCSNGFDLFSWLSASPLGRGKDL